METEGVWKKEYAIVYTKTWPEYAGRSCGFQGTDIAERINTERMRSERLERTRKYMREAGVSVMLLLIPADVRYATGYANLGYTPGMGGALVPLEGEPIIFAHYSCSAQDRRHITWIKPENIRVMIKGTTASPGLSVQPDAEEYQYTKAGKDIKDALDDLKLSKEVVTLDMGNPVTQAALEKFGIRYNVKRDLMVKAQEIKTKDEIECFRSCGVICDMVHWELSKYAEPGRTELELAGYMDYIAMKYGAEPTPLCFAASGPHTWPNWRYSTDRLLRPGDIFYADVIQASFVGYKSCNYRSYSCVTPPSQKAKDAYNRIIEWEYNALAGCKPGNTTADMAKGFPDEQEYWGVGPDYALGDNICHGLGILNYGPPYVSRAWSLKYPYELKEGMVFAIETQDGIGDGQGVRVEDMVVITKDGYEILTRAPYELITCPVRD